MTMLTRTQKYDHSKIGIHVPNQYYRPNSQYTEIWSLSYQCQYIWIYIQNMESTFHLYYTNLTADIHRHQLQLHLLHRVNQRFRDSRSISCDSFFKTKYGRNSSPTSLDPKVGYGTWLVHFIVSTPLNWCDQIPITYKDFIRCRSVTEYKYK